MEGITEQLSDFKESTPKHIQWLLLLAALLVVVILLTLVFTGYKKSAVIISEGEDAPQITFTPSSPLDLSDTVAGTNDAVEKQITISTNASIKIKSLTTNDKPDGFSLQYGTCRKESLVKENTPCHFNVVYKPIQETPLTNIIVTVEWQPGDVSDDKISLKNEYIINLGATAQQANTRQVVQKPEPVQDDDPFIKTTPVPEPEPIEYPDEQNTEQSYDEPVFEYDNNNENNDTNNEPYSNDNVWDSEPDPVTSVKDNLIQGIAPIVQPDPFASDMNWDNDASMQAEACSDFALPGYNTSGRQIGWIKPERGGYYFHPFSDRECNNPTGVYNPENGIITDINNSGKRIGTDAEHIGSVAAGGGIMPRLSNPATRQEKTLEELWAEDEGKYLTRDENKITHFIEKNSVELDVFMGSGKDSVISSLPYDRSFILRQYKPIPATIVSEVRADPSLYDTDSGNIQLPVRATVDRNVYADNGRNVILPTGTLMMGYVTGTLPGPYTAIGRMQIKWYQFILPNGVEFNFQKEDQNPFSADSQGRAGVPGRGSTDYLEQFVMPMITAIVPAAVNMIAPIADKFVNQIDLDNNTVVQSGTMRSSELAKNEIITAWNQVAQKLMVDVMDNTTPPFSIAAGTRITVYSPEDLIVTCDDPSTNKKCAITTPSTNKRQFVKSDAKPKYDDGSWIGQVRSFNWSQYCTNDGKVANPQAVYDAGLDYSSVLFYCQSQQYQAINMAKQDAVYKNQQQQFKAQNYDIDNDAGGLTGISGNQKYNEEILGLKYDDDGAIINPFTNTSSGTTEEVPALTCLDGSAPDINGCCAGEIFTDMGADGWNCCPEAGGDCFPPIK